MKITVTAIDHHRNGIAGTPFYVVLFTHDKRNMMGVVFPEPGSVAVFDADLLAEGNIFFFENSWRGDEYEAALRRACKLVHYAPLGATRVEQAAFVNNWKGDPPAEDGDA